MDWRKIAQYESVGEVVYEGQYPEEGVAVVRDIAITADQYNVWVVWVEDRYYESIDDNLPTRKIHAALIPSNLTNPETIGSSSVPIYDLFDPFYIDDYFCAPHIALTFDPLIDRQNNPMDGDARLIYIDKNVSPYLTKEVPFDTNRVSTPPQIRLELITPAEFDTDATVPRIVYNPYNNPNDQTNQRRAYVLNKTNYVRAFDLTNPATETWQIDPAFNNTVTGNNPDITYRGNGIKCVVWDADNEIYSNHFQDIHINEASLPRISTQGVSQRDIYLTWSDEYDIDSNSSLENVLTLQELYP